MSTNLALSREITKYSMPHIKYGKNSLLSASRLDVSAEGYAANDIPL